MKRLSVLLLLLPGFAGAQELFRYPADAETAWITFENPRGEKGGGGRENRGAKGHPAVVMSIIFAGAPIVNAIVTLAMHPPAGGWSAIRWPFVLGIVLAACGGMLVTLYKPAPGPSPARPVASSAPTQTGC